MSNANSRTALLLELETIVGNACYNGSIQNWGPGGTFEGEGRTFRYPVTFIDESGNKSKRWNPDSSISSEMVTTGYYAFGANRLHIMRALEKVLKHLEQSHQLKVG